MAYVADTYANALTELTAPAAADWVIGFDESAADDAATSKISLETVNAFASDDQIERWLPLVVLGVILTAVTYTNRRVITGATINWPGASTGTLTVTGTAAWGGVTIFTWTYPDHESGSTRTGTTTVTYGSNRMPSGIVTVFT